MSDLEGAWELVMPFVACASQGGAYEDRPFVAGYQAGAVRGVLEAGPPSHEATVYTPLIPQLDLIAMRYGYTMRVMGDEGEGDASTVFVVFEKRRLLAGRPRNGSPGDETVAFLDED